MLGTRRLSVVRPNWRRIEDCTLARSRISPSIPDVVIASVQRTLQAADIAGIRAFAVHAKDDEARAFYQHFGFSPLPSDPYHLFRLLKDIRAERKS